MKASTYMTHHWRKIHTHKKKLISPVGNKLWLRLFETYEYYFSNPTVLIAWQTVFIPCLPTKFRVSHAAHFIFHALMFPAGWVSCNPQIRCLYGQEVTNFILSPYSLKQKTYSQLCFYIRLHVCELLYRLLPLTCRATNSVWGTSAEKERQKRWQLNSNGEKHGLRAFSWYNGKRTVS